MESTLICYIRENSWLAGLAAWRMKSSQMALVLGRTVHLWGATTAAFTKNTRWLRHEACHIKQYQQHGILPFLTRYFKEWVQKGYYQIEFEKEARAAETDPHITNGIIWKVREKAGIES